jgi:hypothetical protein
LLALGSGALLSGFWRTLMLDPTLWAGRREALPGALVVVALGTLAFEFSCWGWETRPDRIVFRRGPAALLLVSMLVAFAVVAYSNGKIVTGGTF